MTDDLTDIELAAEACPTESAGYCQRCKWSVGACTCSARYKFRYAATKERLLALVTELRGLRARNADLEKHMAWRETMDNEREVKEWA